MYSTQSHPTYVRNTECWVADVDLTCISPWNSSGAVQKGGVAISPKHVAYATHFPLGIGTTIAFVANDNSVITRTIVTEAIIQDTDCIIAELNSDLPVSITPAKLVNKSDVSKYEYYTIEIPCIGTDQEEKMLIMSAGSMRSFSSGGYFFTWRNPTNDWAGWYELYVSGDSGSPIFLLINGSLVLVSTAFHPVDGPSLPMYSTEIEAIVTGDGSSVNYVDLSGF